MFVKHWYHLILLEKLLRLTNLHSGNSLWLFSGRQNHLVPFVHGAPIGLKCLLTFRLGFHNLPEQHLPLLKKCFMLVFSGPLEGAIFQNDFHCTYLLRFLITRHCNWMKVIFLFKTLFKRTSLAYYHIIDALIDHRYTPMIVIYIKKV